MVLRAHSWIAGRGNEPPNFGYTLNSDCAEDGCRAARAVYTGTHGMHFTASSWRAQFPLSLRSVYPAWRHVGKLRSQLPTAVTYDCFRDSTFDASRQLNDVNLGLRLVVLFRAFKFVRRQTRGRRFLEVHNILRDLCKCWCIFAGFRPCPEHPFICGEK